MAGVEKQRRERANRRGMLAVAGVALLLQAYAWTAPEEPAPKASRGAAEEHPWPMPLHDPSASASTPEEIAPPLRLAWRREMPAVGKPLVVTRGRVIALSEGSPVALRVEDGEVVWRRSLPEAVAVRERYYQRNRARGEDSRFSQAELRQGPVLLGNLLFAGAVSTLYAVDVSSGAIRWERIVWGRESGATPQVTPQVGRKASPAPSAGQYEWGGFVTYWGDHLLVGTGRDRGHVIALDPGTGRTRWETPALHPSVQQIPDVEIGIRLRSPLVLGHTLFFQSRWGYSQAPAHKRSWRMDGRSGKDLRASALPEAGGRGLLFHAVREVRRVTVRAQPAGGGPAVWDVDLTPEIKREPGLGYRVDTDRLEYAVAGSVLVARVPVGTYEEPPRHSNPESGSLHWLCAVDIQSRRRLWSTRLEGAWPGYYLGNMVCCGGFAYLVEGGDGNERPDVSAFDLRTGARVWSARLPEPLSLPVYCVAAGEKHLLICAKGGVSALRVHEGGADEPQ